MPARGRRFELIADSYVRQALATNDTAEDAAIWLAVWIANEAAASTSERDHVRGTLTEAYRRLRLLADEEAKQS